MNYQLEITQLRGCKIVRPLGALGTCGFYPKAWQSAIIKKRPRETALGAFLRANPNWNASEVKLDTIHKTDAPILDWERGEE